MSKTIFLIAILIVFFSRLTSFGQSDNPDVRELVLDAVKLMDNGQFEKSRELLEKALEIEPDNHIIYYEIAYSYYLQQDYKKALKYGKELLKLEGATDQYFQFVGNTYDLLGDPEKALETYQDGMKLFPKSGRLYLESGVVMLHQEKYVDALEFFEKGIEIEPAYPSNYYWAALLYASSKEPLWGVLYGELFMNIERGSRRTEAISKMLYDTYLEAINIKSKKKAEVKFVEKNIIYFDGDTSNLKLPFSSNYEISMLLSLINVDKKVKIEELYLIRSKFIDIWYEKDFDKDYPNILFDFHEKLIDLGYFESYNYWLYMKGNEKKFDKWLKKHEEAYDAFIEWFKDNPMQIDAEHSFHRRDY